MAVTGFKFLGRVMMAFYDDWPSVLGNLRKERKRWARMLSIIGQEGVDTRN